MQYSLYVADIQSFLQKSKSSLINNWWLEL